jgi:hypothetical protein
MAPSRQGLPLPAVSLSKENVGLSDSGRELLCGIDPPIPDDPDAKLASFAPGLSGRKCFGPADHGQGGGTVIWIGE